MLIVVAVVIAVLIVAAALALGPRIRERSRLRRGGPLPGRQPLAADGLDETEVRRERGRPREERALIAEGEAIREHVEARLEAERPRAATYRSVGDRRPADEFAGQVEQDQRRRYPSTYGAPRAGYVEPGMGSPATGSPATGSPATGSPATGSPATGRPRPWPTRSSPRAAGTP